MISTGRRQRPFQRGLADLAGGLGRWRLWTALAWEDLKSTYKRSMIGVAWVSLSFAIFVAVKVLIFGSMIRGRDLEYFGAYLLLGFFVWQFLSQIVNSAPSVFIGAEGWIRNDPVELSTFVYQTIYRSTFDLALTSIVAAAFFIYFGQDLSYTALLAIPAIAVFLINAVWVKLFLGVICTRFRDLAHLVNTIMRVMFFLTPIVWMPEQLGERVMQFLWWNPFAHFIWIFRTPILDGDPAVESWIFVGVVTVVGWVLALIVFSLFRRRIVFWL